MNQAHLIPSNHTVSIRVSKEAAGMRIDQFISGQFPLYSRSFFKRLIKENLITLNGSPVKPSTIVKTDDLIVIQVPERTVEPQTVLDHALGVEIIYEHKHFLIIYKPAGLVVHIPTAQSKTVTLVDWLLLHYKDIAHVGYVDRPGIVHRLDKDTSGLLIISRTNYAHAVFSKLFKERDIEKTYLALVQGHPNKSGIVNLSIGRDPKNKTKMIALDPNTLAAQSIKLRKAVTQYEVVEYFDEYSLVKVKPITGRTHQIRVHLAAIGHPIVGDRVYGSASKLIKRQALHAYSLSFIFDGQPFSFTQDLPDDFKQLLKKKN